jgi:hypothetical protein
VVYDVVEDNICLDEVDMVDMELVNRWAVAVVAAYILPVVYSCLWPNVVPV